MNPISASQVIELFLSLSEEEKERFYSFLNPVGHHTAEDVFRFVKLLPELEQERFSDLAMGKLTQLIIPWLITLARELVRSNPQASDEELDRLINEEAIKSMELYKKETGGLAAAKIKQSRDRKSDPKIIKRNVEICDLRKKDRRTWSLYKLARRYGVKAVRSIALILADEAKWRRLFRDLSEQEGK